jgi:hypothetical protein
MAGGKFKKFLRKIAPLAVGLIGPIAGMAAKGIVGLMDAKDAKKAAQQQASQPGIASLMGGMGGGAPEAAAPAPFTTNTASVNPYSAEGPASSYASAPQGLRSLAPSQADYGQDEQPMFSAPQQQDNQEDSRQDYAYGGPIYLAHGGIAGLQQHEYAAGGRYLSGPGDGMSDNIRANIEGKQEARLADGEFVIPADVVSHIGNGSSNAGAKKLHAMMEQIRKARTGNPKQGKQIKPEKYLPA